MKERCKDRAGRPGQAACAFGICLAFRT
jgi:hypothetical protein